MSPLTSSPSLASSKSVSRSEVMPAMRWSLARPSSRRLRSCMTFWLFSGWLQKSGEAICSSSLFSLDCCAEASKIPPHGQGLFAEAVEGGAVGRGVADEHQRIEAGKAGQPLGKLGFAVLAGGVERCGIGITESGQVVAVRQEGLAVEIVQAELAAEGADLGGGLMIAGQHIDPFGAGGEDRAAAFQAPAEVHQVARRDVVIGIGGHELLEGAQVAVDIREDQQPHLAKL